METTGDYDAPGVEVEEDFAFQQSSPLSLRQSSAFQSVHEVEYLQHSNSTPQRVIRPSESITHNEIEDESLLNRRLSGRTSISSFPASVLHHDVQQTSARASQHFRNDSFGKTPSPRRQRGLASGFRNPSSIIDMQLNDDTADDTESVVSHHRRSGSRMSVRSQGSNQSSPSKRGSRSAHSSPKKSSGLRKEFPLVLLHCTLLPSTNNWMGPACDNDLFAALLPDGYRQRWVQLQDKLSSNEVKSRGILLPHPQEDYELLEERLLEALELETPRIQGAHFDDKGADSGFESGSQTGSDADDDKCPDCGKCLGRAERRWEIKVFAANGLMRGAAWTAAWRDMEKVDVEIGLWMPEDVRREVSTRLEALHAAEQESRMEEAAREEEHISDQSPRFGNEEDSRVHQQSVHEPVPSLIALIFQDRKSTAVLLISVLVAVYALLTTRAGMQSHTPAIVEHVPSAADTTTITSTAVWTTTVVAHEPSPVTIASSAPVHLLAEDVSDLPDQASKEAEAAAVREADILSVQTMVPSNEEEDNTQATEPLKARDPIEASGASHNTRSNINEEQVVEATIH